jgi:hypothetical protein
MAEETNPNVDPNETIPEGGAQPEETVSKKEFDRRVNALTAKTKAFEQEKADLQAKLDEIEAKKKEKTFAELSKEEQEKAKFSEERERFEIERKEFEQVKLTNEVASDLAEKGLPKSLAKALSLVGDKDKIIAIADEAMSEQQEILKENLKQQLAGKTPVKRAGNIEVTKADFAKMTLAERTELYSNNRELYDSLK